MGQGLGETDHEGRGWGRLAMGEGLGETDMGEGLGKTDHEGWGMGLGLGCLRCPP